MRSPVGSSARIGACALTPFTYYCLQLFPYGIQSIVHGIPAPFLKWAF